MKSKVIFILACICAYVPNLFSQSIEWVDHIKATGSDYSAVWSSTVDEDQNVISTGYFKGTVDFDPGDGVSNLTSTGFSGDVFIQKVNAEGELQWAVGFGGSSVDEGRDVITNSLGEVYITGYRDSYSGEVVDYDPGAGVYELTTNNGWHMFALKLDADGEFIWAKILGDTDGEDYARGIALDSEEFPYIYGRFEGTIDFNPDDEYLVDSDGGSFDTYVMKLNPEGDFLWVKTTGGSSSEWGLDIEADLEGGIYMAGSFRAPCDFDPGVDEFELVPFGDGPFYESEAFLQKLDTAGNFEWVRRIGGTGRDEGRGVDIDDDGHVYLLGMFSDTADLDPSDETDYHMTTGGGFNTDIFVTKLNLDGDYIWGKSIHGDGFDLPYNIGVDQYQNVFIGSSFGGTVEFSHFDSLSTTSFGGIALIGLNENGNFNLAHNFGSDAGGVVYETYVDGDYLYVGGAFDDTTDFDVGYGEEMFYGEFQDGFLAKYFICEPQADTAFTDASACSSYLWDENGITYTETGLYTTNLTNILGCDSTIGLNLTLLNSPPHTDSVLMCSESYTWPENMMTYDSSSIDSVIYMNSFGCDSIRYLDLIIAPIDTAYEEIEICESYTVPSGDETYTVSGIYTDTLSNLYGCDSIIVIDLTIYNTENTVETVVVCGEFTVPSGDETYFVSGAYQDTLETIHGCDSIIVFNATINPIESVTEVIVICNEYTVPSGDETYFESGVYMDTLTTIHGCDSLISIELTIHNSEDVVMSVSACDSYTTPDGDTFFESGVYMDTTTSIYGCDSLTTINYTIHNTEEITVDISACDEYTAPSGMEVYTESGIYIDTINTVYGCDSIITINLTVNPTVYEEMDVAACDEFTVPSGDETYTVSGIYTDTLTTALGCDSIITMNLTIELVDLTVTRDILTLTATEIDASYQWVDCDNSDEPIVGEVGQTYDATENGNYAVIISKGECSSRSECTLIEDVSIFEDLLSSIRLYPNPTNGLVTIDLGENDQEVTIIVRNVLGDLVLEKKVNSTQLVELNLETAEAGIYFVTITTPNYSVGTLKLTKN